MKPRIIINFCPTGMVPDKTITPYVPVSPNEIIEQTHQAYEIGITIVHLHARAEDSSPCYKKSIYQKIFEGIRKHCPDLVICGSTSGRKFTEFEKRSEVIELKPDMCSLTLSSVNFLTAASINEPEVIRKLADKMNRYGVTPELECFDLGMINYGKYLINQNILNGPFYWNLIFGNIAGFQAKSNHVEVALSEIPADHFVGIGGIGSCQFPVNTMAIEMGHGVRVGIEDNIWWDSAKTKKCTNLELIKRIHLLIESSQKEFFPPFELGSIGFYNR